MAIKKLKPRDWYVKRMEQAQLDGDTEAVSNYWQMLQLCSKEDKKTAQKARRSARRAAVQPIFTDVEDAAY